MKRYFFVGLFSILLIVLLIGFVSTWADNGSSSQNVDGCNQLNTTGAIYTLIQNVSSNGTCFTVTAENVTLNCNGYWINYSIGGTANTYGAYSDQFNTTIKNCNIVDGNWTNIAGADRIGIYFYEADNGMIFNNYIKLNNSAAIFLEGEANLNNISNNTIYSGLHGIDIQGNNNYISNNLANSSGVYYSFASPIIIYGGQNNNLINNILTGKYNGLYFANYVNNTFIRNLYVLGTEGIGIYSEYGNNNTFINVTIIGKGSYGLSLSISANNTFKDSNFSGGLYDTFYGFDEGSVNNSFVNCTYETERVNGASNTLFRKWYYQAYVNNTEGSVVSNANVTAYNSSGQLQFTTLTNSSGYINRQEVVEYVNRGGTTNYYSNYTIFANKSGAISNDTNLLNITVTQNNLNDFFTLEEEGIDCSELNISGNIYTLISNVSSNGTCFTVTAENVTLDCNGYWINYSINGSDNSRGVYTNQFNTTVKNCNIVDGNWSKVSETREGIFVGYNNCTIFNNTIRTNTSAGLNSNSNLNNITKNNVISGRSGISISGDNNTLVENTANCTTVAATSGQGIYISGAYNYLVNNTAGSVSYALSLGERAYYTTLINNTAISSQGTALLINGVSNNLLINQLSSGNIYGIGIEGNSSNNLFLDCRSVVGSDTDLNIGYDLGALNNTFLNCSYISEDIHSTDGQIIRKWYYQAYVNNTEGSVVSNANVTAYNSSGQLQFTTLTNSSGYINRQEVVEYVNRGGTTNYYSNYTIFANKSGAISNDTNLLNITVTQNNLNDFFTLTESADSTSPTYSQVSINNTFAGQVVKFAVNVNDNSILHPNGQYIFSTNNTGTWINDSAVNFTSTPSWANVTKTLNSSVGMVIGYRWYFNDSAGNTNSTGIYTLTTTSSQSSYWTDELTVNGGFEWGNLTGWTTSGAYWQVGNVSGGEENITSINGSYSAYTSSGIVSGYIYQDVNVSSYSSYIDSGDAQINASGWRVSAELAYDSSRIQIKYLFGNLTEIETAIDSGYDFIQPWERIGVFEDILPVGARYVRVWGNTYENSYPGGSLDSFSVKLKYTGEDSTSPTYISISHNSTLANYPVIFSINVSDETALNPNGQYIFSTNNTGTWINDSAVNFTSTPSWANVTKTLNSSVGMVIGYRWYFNDSAGNTNSTGIYTLTITSISLFPYFTTIPNNASLFYGNQSLDVYFSGTDDTGFGYYRINDTRFSINQSGYLINATPMAVGNYEINVTINNTLGNINWTRYKVQINKSVSDVYLYVNNLRSNITVSNSSSIWLNGTLQKGTGVINLYNNGTLINSGSSPIYNLTQFNNIGVYNITVLYSGNENYTSDYETWWVNASNYSSSEFNQIIANHTIVDRYDDIPQYYINEVKKMLVDMGGESHSMGYQNGVNLLELYNSKFQVQTYEDTAPPAETNQYLRLGRPHMYGEDIWTSQTGIDNLISDIEGQNDTGNPFDIFGFGWCWDMTWENLPGGTEDPVFNVRWAGSSDGGPNGSMRWGLDSGDEALTGNVVSMDNYLDAIEQYNTYFEANNIPTVAIFTTGPVDTYTDENAYQRELKHEYIRNYTLENSSRILFDYADILYYNDTGHKYTEEWNDNGDMREYAQIHPDNLLNYNSTWGMEDTGDPDSDHIGEVGTLRLAKAMWWMLARIAGWDGQNNTAPVTSLSSPSNGSSFSPGQITFQCNLTDDYDLKNTTLYVWNSTGNLISSNLSTNISGISNSTSINYTLNNNGNYLWNCLTYDGDSVSNFSVTNKTVIISSGADTTPPTYSLVSHNSTLANYIVLFSVNVSDGVSLNNSGGYTFSTNNTGTWINDSAVNFTSTPSWANVTKTLNSSVGMVIGYRWYFNDSAGNTNSTGIYTLTTEQGCETLDAANTIYTLTQNVSSQGTCFDITANNVTLDCAGYWINYSIGGEANTYGVYSYNTNNLTIKNCNIIDGNWSSITEYSRAGIELNAATNGTVFNNTIRANNSYALYLYNTANYNNLTANTVFSNTSIGIILSDYSAYNTLMNNTASSNGDAALFLYQYSDNNTLIANNITSRFAGCFIYFSGYNNLSNNTCRNIIGTDYGLYLYDAYNNLFINNTAISEFGTATQLGVSLNNTFIKHTSIVSGSGEYSFSLNSATNNTLIRDCVNISGPNYHINANGNSINNTLINCSYQSESLDDSSSQLTRKWYYQAYTNYSNGTKVADATISAYNITGQLQFTALTNSSGWIGRQEVTEYVNTGGTRSYYNNYTINATLSGYDTDSNVLNFTIEQNKIDDVFTLSEAGDTTSPYFTTIPNNASLFYANQSLGVDFDATDAVGFGYFSINDTRFSINQSGYLSNITSLTVGNYEINVTINDTSNNINWIRYKVQVNQSQDSCSVYFNTSSPITHPSTFIAYTNCTSAYTLRLNGTIISNGTTINSGATAYNISVQRTDTQNYSNTFNQQQFIINKNTETCKVLFNATSPLTYPNTFTVWANCTSAFTLYRNGTTISNNSEQALAVGTYNFSMLRNDTANYTIIYNETQFTITAAPDVTPPYFTSIPNNASLFYANQSLSVDFDATDAVGFGYFSINDTRFSINQSGYLSNTTALKVGNYEINVTINDTSNNINWTRYKVQVNQSQNSCSVYFNTSSPIIYPSTFIAYTNCTSAYTLRLNGTIISNGTTINSGATAYNISVQRTDTQNYSNTFNQQQFIINKNTETCKVLFNATSPLTYPNTFTVWANCTSPFVLSRNGTTISNNSEQALAVGTYNFSMLRNDTSNYTIIYNETQFTINAAPDTTPPYFTTIPNNASLFYANQSLGVDFDATDAVGFGYFSTNDTRFSINQSGYLSNLTQLTVGNYEINITINDTSNNINWIRYKVQVNQSQDSCSVYFNTSSPITHPSTFIAYTNCTSAYTLRLNATVISNGTTINSGATAYNISVQRIDTQNYSNTFNQQQFIINKNTETCKVLFNATSPLTYPNTFTVWANCTSAFTLYRNGTTISNNSEQALAVGTYNFSMLRNDTSNYTIIYNETQFTINAAPDTTPPTYSLVSHNSTLANYMVLFSVNVSDGVSLNNSGGYTFSTNNTGTWINDSFVTFASTPSWANVTKTLNSSVGMIIGYRWYFNDSAGNTNSTGIYTLTTTANLIPGENSCGILGSTNTVYTLTQNVSSNGTCFTVTAENVTLDCNGYWINYSQSEFGYGINITNRNNISIRDCSLFGGEENYTHGILVYNSTNVRLYNNSINTLGDISDGISIYISNYTSIYNNTIINSGYNGHGIYNSFSSYNNITNSNIDAEYYAIYLEYNSNNHNFSNLNIISNYGAGIVINSSADNNLFYNINILVSGFGQGVILSSDFNYLSDLDISSELGESLKVSGSNNNISRSRFNSTDNDSVYFESGEENLFFNNTLLSSTGNVNNSLLRISDIAYNNSFYWNNFTETGGYYVNNSNFSNKFNTTVLGNAQGNEYSNIFYRRVYDSNSNGWGDDGEEYPINSTNWIDKWAGYGQDYGPRTLRLEDLIAPSYNLVSHNNTIAGEICRFRVNISDNYRLHSTGQYIFSTNNTGTWINDSVINFTSTPYLADTIKTLNSSLNKVVGYKWYFNDFSGNDNSTRVYTLKTEEEEEEDENSGSGGGGGSEDEQVILKPSYPQIQEGYETPISKGYLIQFNLSEKGQYVADIKNVNRFTGVINFSINSTNYSVSLSKSIKINLNNDTYYDLEASVLTITFFNTSRMLFKEIHEDIYSSNSSGVNETSLGNKTIVDFFGGSGKGNGFKFVYILIILTIIVLISLVGYIVFIRLKKTLSPIEHKNL